MKQANKNEENKNVNEMGKDQKRVEIEMWTQGKQEDKAGIEERCGDEINEQHKKTKVRKIK